MRILFLDDNAERLTLAQKHFKQKFEYFEATTAEEAIEMLKNNSPFNVVYLDHDLGNKVFVPSDEKSGAEVARYIASMTKKTRPKVVIVHSWNPAGAKNILNILANKTLCQYEPFNTNLFNLPYDDI